MRQKYFQLLTIDKVYKNNYTFFSKFFFEFPCLKYLRGGITLLMADHASLLLVDNPHRNISKSMAKHYH
jgi:hypothetical protein